MQEAYEDRFFNLCESSTMMRYLSNQYPNALYPEDFQERAKVEEFMDWNHVELRLVTNRYVRLHYFDIVRGKQILTSE